jgi:hypothetical protein
VANCLYADPVGAYRQGGKRKCASFIGNCMKIPALWIRCTGGRGMTGNDEAVVHRLILRIENNALNSTRLRQNRPCKENGDN